MSLTIEAAERFIYIGRQREAHRQVREAVKWGKLTKLPCQVCGDARRPEAHHRDYSLPLGVIWLCSTHHRLAGKIEELLSRCSWVVSLAVDSDALWALAEVFAHELTGNQHRLPHCKRLCLAELSQNVEKLLVLLLLVFNSKEQRRAC